MINPCEFLKHIMVVPMGKSLQAAVVELLPPGSSLENHGGNTVERKIWTSVTHEKMRNIWNTYGFQSKHMWKDTDWKKPIVSSWIFPTKTIHKNVELFGDGYVYIYIYIMYF